MPTPRPTCYRCHRPQSLCLCESVTAVDNQTRVIILQHPQESRHPLGTVRLARLGLRKLDVQIAWPTGRHAYHRPLSLPAKTGLLYPSEHAVELHTVAGTSQQPQHLVVLDGTWWQARRLFRDNPWLADLPHYRLSPSSPSQYRIRREPQAHCLSTIESIVASLQELEPNTAGLNELLQSFVQMIDRHLAQRPTGTDTARNKRPRQCSSRAIPRALTIQAEHLVAIYGEATPRAKRLHPDRAELLQWVAVRPATGETFQAFFKPGQALDEEQLQHLRLSASNFQRSSSLPEFLAAWHRFLGPKARLTAWNASPSKLFSIATGEHQEPLYLKHAYCNLRQDLCGTLDLVSERENLSPTPLALPGRAAQRLGQVCALLEFVQHIASQDQAPHQPSPPKQWLRLTD